jgi:hypothetical protein
MSHPKIATALEEARVIDLAERESARLVHQDETEMMATEHGHHREETITVDHVLAHETIIEDDHLHPTDFEIAMHEVAQTHTEQELAVPLQ